MVVLDNFQKYKTQLNNYLELQRLNEHYPFLTHIQRLTRIDD